MSQIIALPTLTHRAMPKGTTALYFIQMISILSFSVLYSTLILYTTKGLHMDDMKATSITGAFLALNYFLHLVSGLLGGRYLSFRSLFAISMLLQVLGCLLIAIPDQQYLLIGLAPFLAGCGLNISCINCMLMQLFNPEDKKRDSAFLWNYSGQNIGIFVGFLLAGYFDLKGNYQQLFIISALGNIVALLLTFANWNILNDLHTHYIQLSRKTKNLARLKGLALITLLIFCIYGLVQYTYFCEQLIIAVTLLMFAYLIMLAQKQSIILKNKIYAYCILAIATIIFWTLILVGPMGLNLFIERNVDLTLLGIKIAPQWVQNMSTIVIIIAAPLISTLFAFFA